MVDRDMIPVIEVFFRSLDELQFLLWIIDERAEFPLLGFAQCRTEEFSYFTLDITGGILQYMLKSLVFSVQVCQEMLSTFWQVKDSLEVDDLCAGIGHRWKGLCQQL